MFLAASSLLLAQAAATPAQRQLTAQERALIQNTVVSELTDPDSAQFKMLPLAIASDQYCALVNAKNRFGGYVGFRPFIIYVEKDDRGEVVSVNRLSIDSGRSAFASRFTRTACEAEGYNLNA